MIQTDPPGYEEKGSRRGESGEPGAGGGLTGKELPGQTPKEGRKEAACHMASGKGPGKGLEASALLEGLRNCREARLSRGKAQRGAPGGWALGGVGGGLAGLLLLLQNKQKG